MIDKVICFCQIDEANFQGIVACLSEFLKSEHDEHHIDCQALGLEAALFLGENLSFLAEVAKSIGHDFEKNVTSMHDQREAPVVATLCPILLLV